MSDAGADGADAGSNESGAESAVETAVENAAETKTENAFDAITSQEQLDRVLGQRLARERDKYKDFDAYKAKAEKFDKVEADKLTDDERRTQERDSLKQERDEARKEIDKLKLDALRKDVAADKGLPAKFASRLSGDSREDLEADADDILEAMPKQVKSPASQKPAAQLKGGGKAGDEVESTADRQRSISEAIDASQAAAGGYMKKVS